MVVVECTIASPSGLGGSGAGYLKLCHDQHPELTMTLTHKGKSVDAGNPLRVLTTPIRHGETVAIAIEGGTQELQEKIAANIKSFLEQQ